MTLRQSLRGICALATCLVVSPAFATPEDRTVSYCVYDDPANPQHVPIYYISLQLTPVGTDGDSIGWQVDQIAIARMNPNGTVNRKWSQVLPSVDTPDGLWWVDHLDAESPAAAEFTMPPPIGGQAAAGQSGAAALNYDLAGTTCSGDCETEELAVASILYVRLQQEDESEPELDKDEEPAETEDDVIS